MRRLCCILLFLGIFALEAADFKDFVMPEELLESFSLDDQEMLRKKLSNYPLPVKLPDGHILLVRSPQSPYELWGELVDTEYGLVLLSKIDDSKFCIFIYASKDAQIEFCKTLERGIHRYEVASRVSTWWGLPSEQDMSSLSAANFIAFFLPFGIDLQITFANTSLYFYVIINKANQRIFFDVPPETFIAAAERFQNLFLPPAEPPKALTWKHVPDIQLDGDQALVTYDYAADFQDYWWRVDANQGVLSVLSDHEDWWHKPAVDGVQAALNHLRVSELDLSHPLELTFYAISPDGEEWYSSTVVYKMQPPNED